MKETQQKQRLLSQVRTYLKQLNRNITENKIRHVLDAMDVIDRSYFVTEEYAYIDTAIPIQSGQTISQPSTVARMVLELDLNEGDNVLEIGSGSGWNATLIGYLTYPGSVTSIERVPELNKQARDNYIACKNECSPDATRRLDNVTFRTDNLFTLTAEQKESYSRIICTAGYRKEQYQYIRKICGHLLQEGGKAVFPQVLGPLTIFMKKQGNIHVTQSHEEYQFVPLQEN